MENKNYWENPEYYEKRREEMIKDKIENGLSNAQLVTKYGISQNRILSIVKKFRDSNKFKGVK